MKTRSEALTIYTAGKFGSADRMHNGKKTTVLLVQTDGMYFIINRMPFLGPA